jgi:hypothetical protein
LLDTQAECVDLIEDLRDPSKVKYPLRDCYRSGFALFFLQDPSLLEFQRRFEDQIQQNNLRTVFGVEQIPADSQLRDVIDTHDYGPLLDVFGAYFSKLQRSKQLERYQFYNDYYLLTLDGSQYFNSERVHCDRCLSSTKKNSPTRYYHQILQPALVHPDLRQVIPLAPEFIRKRDGNTKQDCEINAAKRAVKRIRGKHRQLAAIIVADSLYSTSPFIDLLSKHRFSFFLGVKPDSHTSLFADVAGMRRGKLLDRLVAKEKDRHYLYEWLNDITLNDSAHAPSLNYMELKIYDSDGIMTRHFSWVTDIQITKENVRQLVRGARARWKIENEGFNTLKNHGYHLEHNFGHGKKHLSEAFFALNLLAFFMHQIFELVDGAYQQARAGFSARREFWNAIRASFRLLLFSSWDEVLARMNSPPQPAFSCQV